MASDNRERSAQRRPLWAIGWVGTAVYAIACVAALSYQDVPTQCAQASCAQQLAVRACRLDRIATARANARAEQLGLANSLGGPVYSGRGPEPACSLEAEASAGAAARPRADFGVATQWISALDARRAGLHVEPLPGFWGQVRLFGPYALILLAALVVGHLALRLAPASSLQRPKLFARALPIAVAYTVYFSAVSLLGQAYTSMIDIDKDWFGWDSYCVSSASFAASAFMNIGLNIAAAFPLSVFTCLALEDARPGLNSGALEDGDVTFGVGDYIHYWEVWSFWGLVPVGGVTVWFIHDVASAATVEAAYLIAAALSLLPIVWLFWRVFRHAHVIREEYQAKRKEYFSERKDVLPSYPDDPTIPFLGTSGWRFPGTVTAVVATMWIVSGQLGLTSMQRDAARVQVDTLLQLDECLDPAVHEPYGCREARAWCKWDDSPYP